jgi:uncharacterized RDD family membrane protein YckC
MVLRGECTMSSNKTVEGSKNEKLYKLYRSVDYSGFIERLFARGVDFLFTAGLGFLLYKYLGFSLPAAVIIAVLFDLIYRIVMTYFLGWTIGKFLFGVRVISRCSEKLSIWQVLIRETSKYISGVFTDLGYASIIFSRRKRAWHDIIACTAVISGGRDEAQYGRDVYSRNPEKWHIAIAAPAAAVFVAALLITINRVSFNQLDAQGMLGFDKGIDSLPETYEYKLPSAGTGAAGANKDLIQVGDINSDASNELFREGIADGKVIITNIRLSGSKPADGNIKLVFDMPVIQFKMLDINGDKNDELAVLFEDKTLKIYSLADQPTEIVKYGPVEYGEITDVIKGKPADNVAYRLYILGDKNKLSVLSMQDGKLNEQKLNLPDNLTGISMGRFSGKNYLAGLREDGRLTFYSYDGKEYQKARTFILPQSGSVSMDIRDVNSDGSNEVLLTSFKDGRESMAAYAASGTNLKLVWDGRGHYTVNGKRMPLVLGDALTGSDSFRAYMVSKEVSGQQGKFSILVFDNDSIMFIVNDFMRALSLTKP